jgi:hypothetical protein
MASSARCAAVSGSIVAGIAQLTPRLRLRILVAIYYQRIRTWIGVVNVASASSDLFDFAPPQPVLGLMLANIHQENLRKH